MDKDFNKKYLKLYQNGVSNGLRYSHSKYLVRKVEFNNKELDCVFVDGTKYIYRDYEKIMYGTSAGKLFIYAISKLGENTNVSKFFINEYLDIRGYSRINNGIEQLNNDILAVSSITTIINEKVGFHHVVISMITKGKYVYAEFNKNFVEYVKQFYFWIPKSLYQTKDIKSEWTWAIGYYIFQYFMQNKNAKNKVFRKSVRDILNNSNVINCIDTNRKKQLLYTPFINALKYLNEIQDTLKIEILDYSNDFIDKMIEIKVLDTRLLDCYKTPKKLNIEEHKRSKHEYITKTLELRNKSYTVVQIAEELGK